MKRKNGRNIDSKSNKEDDGRFEDRANRNAVLRAEEWS